MYVITTKFRAFEIKVDRYLFMEVSNTKKRMYSKSNT